MSMKNHAFEVGLTTRNVQVFRESLKTGIPAKDYAEVWIEKVAASCKFAVVMLVWF